MLWKCNHLYCLWAFLLHSLHLFLICKWFCQWDHSYTSIILYIESGDSKPFSAILCHCCDWGIRPSHTLVCGGTPEAHAYQIRFCVLVCSFPNHSLIIHFLFFFLFFPFLQLHLNTGLIVSTLAPHSGIAINQSPLFYMQI